MGILSGPADYGCDGHPSVQGHTKMYAGVAPVLGKVMHWD
jgi:hypothetical protein